MDPLETKRNEVCLPIAQAILEDMSLNMFKEDEKGSVDLTPIALGALQKSLDADLNTTTDTPYVFQLLLSSIAGLNATSQTCELVPLDDAKYAEVALDLLKVVAEAKIDTTLPDQEVMDAFGAIKDKIEAVYKLHGINKLEVKYILDNIFTSLNVVNGLYGQSIEKSMKKAEENLFGVADMSELTLGTIDKVLKKDIVA